MRFFSITISLLSALYTSASSAHPSSFPAAPLLDRNTAEVNGNISLQLFAELEELSRIVDISYCVGMTGISKPFGCASRCDDFPDFELVDTFNTGPMMSDSCGYIALDHGTKRFGTGRIIVAFRGTYSIANTIVDLSTVPQEYVPYPDNPDNSSNLGQPSGTPQKDHHWRFLDLIPRFSFSRSRSTSRSKSGSKEVKKLETKCGNCTVHTGFWTSWQNTRPFILPHVKLLQEKYPAYRLDLVGHSLGGAVAALAGLEFLSLGWDPVVTTFGEPRVGNVGLRNYIDKSFNLTSQTSLGGIVLAHWGKYRRVTHVDDPVPLLPLYQWGYRSHAGELFISKASLQPTLSDVHMCSGDDDLNCIAGAEEDKSWFKAAIEEGQAYDLSEVGLEFESNEDLAVMRKRWGIPARFKMWQLFFAHRDYFWRLGLCVPGGDPLNWGRNRYDFDNGDGGDGEPKEEL